MTDNTRLDNPIWHALTSVHAPLAMGRGLARCYPPDVSPLSALADPSAAAFEDLLGAAGPGRRIALLAPAPMEIPGGWQVLRSRFIDQMVCPFLREGRSHPHAELGGADVPDMLALTAATEPGPFLSGTIRMGRYIGIRDGARLAAMAGQRLRMDGFTEISAVCTDPAYRGRGYAAALMTPLIEQVLREGCTPFLHVKTENEAAKSVYRKLGFEVRRAVWYAVLTPES